MSLHTATDIDITSCVRIAGAVNIDCYKQRYTADTEWNKCPTTASEALLDV
jgi:hypothetical protein